jgi:hypothetical protein
MSRLSWPFANRGSTHHSRPPDTVVGRLTLNGSRWVANDGRARRNILGDDSAHANG